MITAADGTAFTGSVTVAVTGDSGTQAAGSVGSAACAHEGGGYHSYRPSQAETNYDHVAFTFSGTGAIPVTVQVFTKAGDAFTRLGAPAGASVSADIAAVKVDTAATLVDTGTTLPATLATIAGYLDTEIAAILEDTGTTLPAQISALNNLDSTAVQTAAAAALTAYDPPTNAEMEARTLASASYATATALQTVDDELATVDGVVDAIKAKTDSLTFTVAGQVDANMQAINDVAVTGDGQVGTEFSV